MRTIPAAFKVNFRLQQTVVKMLTLRFIPSARRYQSKTKDYPNALRTYHKPGNWHKPSRYVSFFFVLLAGSCTLGYYKIEYDNKQKSLK